MIRDFLEKNNKKLKYKKYVLFVFTIFLINSPPIYAYAGPGAAIGAILVFLTVVLAFFASTFIRLFNISKKIIQKLFKSDSKKQKKNKKK